MKDKECALPRAPRHATRIGSDPQVRDASLKAHRRAAVAAAVSPAGARDALESAAAMLSRLLVAARGGAAAAAAPLLLRVAAAA